MVIKTDRLAAWWCDLNCGRWPVDLALPPLWSHMTVFERVSATSGAWRIVDSLAHGNGHGLWARRTATGQRPYSLTSTPAGRPPSLRRERDDTSMIETGVRWEPTTRGGEASFGQPEWTA